MPIAALSEKAARAICSTLVLNDAISVIKELIDNALDANASNIIIELSANTLDTIQVKDNGAGVGVEDRQLLCKRGFTSKIRTFEDLAQLGGTFLGFRGEALASVAGLSDNITFTTRIDGEAVGTFLRFDSNGKLISSSSAAHGTGTTVRVSEFLKSIPVRRQTALKQAAKTLNNVKKLLFDYAFARPTVRFQFKVLKSGGDLKANWSFVPCKDASNLNILASKIVGKDVAAQCEQATVISDDGGYKIDALLFAKDTEISKCSNTDRFVSIDGRPLTVDRGLMKDLNKIYKSYLHSVLPNGTVVPNKVFLLLRLDFPRGTYDVNVEPTKNEVMFEDSGLVLDLFERLCKLTYGEKDIQLSTKKDVSRKCIDSTANFELLLAQKAPSAIPEIEPKETSAPVTISKEDQELQGLKEKQDATSESGTSKETKVFRNMYGVDEQDLLAPQSEDNDALEERSLEEAEDIMDPRVTNPFVLAKVNTLLRPRNLSDAKSYSSPMRHDVPRDITTQNDDQSISSRSDKYADLLPSPSPSPERNMVYQNPGPPNRPWKTRQVQNVNDQSNAVSPMSFQHTLESAKTTLLDNWTRSINSSSPRQASPSSIEVGRSESINFPARVATKPTSNSLQKQTPSKRPMGLSSTHQSAFRTPFKSTPDVGGGSPFSEGRSVRSQTVPTPTQQTASPSPVESNNPKVPGLETPRALLDIELDDIMDFEHRKRNTILEHREKTRRPRSDKGLKRDAQEYEEQPFSVPARPEQEGLSSLDQDATYGSKFGQGARSDDIDIPTQPNSASYTQNPHWNRYKKALRDLEDRTEKQSAADTSTRAIKRRKTAEEEEEEAISESHDKDQDEPSIKLSPRDPRAYLIRLAREKGIQIGGNASKPKKSMMTKLPFETIEPAVATYTYVGTMELGVVKDARQLSTRIKVLEEIDSYVRAGRICSGMPQGSMTEDISRQWESKIRSLLDGTNITEFGGSRKDDSIATAE